MDCYNICEFSVREAEQYCPAAMNLSFASMDACVCVCLDAKRQTNTHICRRQERVVSMREYVVVNVIILFYFYFSAHSRSQLHLIVRRRGVQMR